MKKQLIFIVLAGLGLNLNAQQEIKLYQGTFGTGKATYQYYENAQSDRIYQGSFSYTGNRYATIGQFNENKRSGTWKTSATNKTVLNDKKIKIQQSTLLTGRYMLGEMDSIWSYSQTYKRFHPKTKKALPKPDKVSSKANFSGKHFNGQITYESIISGAKTTITGQFAKNGMPDGIWTINRAKELEEWKFADGMLYARMVKDLTTGEKRLSYDSSQFMADFIKNYDSKQKMAVINGKMYFADTTVYSNEAIAYWTEAEHQLAGFGAIPSAMYDFRKGQNQPEVKLIRIISCDAETDCFKRFEERKKAEADRLKREKDEEEKRIQAEILSKEEEARKERERLAEEARKQEIANTFATGRELYQQKKYKQALLVFQKVDQMQPHDDIVAMNIAGCKERIKYIDSMQNYRLSVFNELKAQVDKAFGNTAEVEADLKKVKKVYATNYRLCMDQLTEQFTPAYERMEFISEIQSDQARIEQWTGDDDLSLTQLEDLRQQMHRINSFQNAVNYALTTNNKPHLRVLNSSLNPQVIVDDMIKFK